MGGGGSTDKKEKEEPTMDVSTHAQMTENSSGFHVLELHMPSMGTGMGMLLLVGAAVLALRWWAQRRQAKKHWLQGGASTARPHSPSRWAAGATPGAYTGQRRQPSPGCMGGRPRAASRSCPQDRLAPLSRARRVLRAVGWPRRPPWRLTRTWRGARPWAPLEARRKLRCSCT